MKLFNRILDSSLAEDPKLRHFFIDLLLCADPDGNVIMTKEAIARKTRATPEDVEWGLSELQKPDKTSLTPIEGGRRIVPLDGHGYGWRIVNFSMYRDYKSAREMRADTAERVAKHRERKRNGTIPGKTLEQAIEDELQERTPRKKPQDIPF